MKQYIVVRDFTIEDLIKEVNRRLSLGYELLGGLAVKSNDNGLKFFQAMTIEEKDES